MYEDPKILTAENLDKMNKQDIHSLCKILELPLTGDKQTLLVRVAGVLAYQQGSWGKVKKSLKRKNDNAKSKIVIPNPSEDDDYSSTNIQDSVEKFIEEHPEGWSFEDESEFRNNLADDNTLVLKANYKIPEYSKKILINKANLLLNKIIKYAKKRSLL